MKKFFKSDIFKGFLIGIITMAIIAVIGMNSFIMMTSTSASDKPDSISSYKKIKEVMSYIDNCFLEDVDQKTLKDYMFLGLVTGLGDQYSAYYTKEEYEAIKRSQAGDYRGIGVTISNREDDGALMINAVTEGGPAQKVGLLEGDLILTIDGDDYSKATTSEASSYIRSLDADSVLIVVFRESTDETLTFDVAIEDLEAYSVGYTMLDDNIGYIYIASFTARTAEQFKNAREDLEDQGMDGLIIDLRNDGGGLVSGVADTLSDFIPEGDVLVYTLTKDGTRTDYKSSGGTPFEVPVVTLVNENTASSAEIFTGAVQDYGLATVVGTVTYGKGIVQNAYTLSDGSVLKITVSHYYTPNGNDIHEHGITPDVEVENTQSEDLQYEKAVEIIKEQIED